ncbi:MAG TPA: DUF3099 domain-containing protein [Micromonosporaceae bacterium]
MVRRQADRPILITDAQRSQAEQLRSRQRRYVVMMLFRAGVVVLAAVLVGTGVPMLGLWLPLCGVCMILIPWLAVILANDRAPKEKYRLANRFHRTHRDDTPRALPAPAGDRTIEHRD